MIVRLAIGALLMACVVLALAGCTVNVNIPPAPAVRASASVPPAPRGHLVNPCAVVICGLHPSRIA